MPENINFKYSTAGAGVDEPATANARIDDSSMTPYAKSRLHADVAGLGAGPFRGIKIDVEGTLGSVEQPGRTNFSQYNVEGQS